MSTFTIGDRAIGAGEPTFVIAEAGSNHNGDLSLARELIDVAANAGADAVKFQTFRAENLYVEDSGEADYLDDDRSMYQLIEDMEMPYEWIPKLHRHCRDRGVYFMSTPFDERSVDELAEYVPAFKIASYTMSHHPFLEYVAESGLPVLMSTGAHEMDEIRDAVEVFRQSGLSEFGLLQCVASYPAPLESSNVSVVETLRDEFGVPTGLSDHTLDPTIAPSAAVALGADVVEKHITLDKSMDGPDHQFALEPDELSKMVDSIQKTEKVVGDGVKRVLDVERELEDIARRRIHATTDISAGDRLTEANIAVLRSGNRRNGLEPKFYDEVLGATVTEDIPKDTGITWDVLDSE
ncbi:N-acetylneuraminate synthase family protein [Haloarcula sp. GH36]|uniref:N-acetylneuraminate synthase family protein n=1 Tax=Haloarcula montana TaxID=3111776 RepID=UPI002D78774D|nr:N-acetylneuraminate synthase family protein [Haloarcula sp. GH36]